MTRENANIAPTTMASRHLGGLLVDEIAAELGITQQWVCQSELKALKKLSAAMRRERFVFSKEELLSGRMPKIFIRALTHALAEKAFADRWGLSLEDARWAISELGIDPNKPETWLTKSIP